MASQNCIYKAVTMKAGEVFVLPPGAELISVTDANAVTSSCSDNLPEAELKCYRVAWVFNTDEEGMTGAAIQTGIGPVPGIIEIPDFNNAWDAEESPRSIIIDSISLGGTITTGLSIDPQQFSQIESTIAGLSSGGLLMDRKYKRNEALSPLTLFQYGYWPTGYRSGYIEYNLYFKATEDIAKTMYLQFSGSENIGSVPRYTPGEIDCEDYPTDSDIVSCPE